MCTDRPKICIRVIHEIRGLQGKRQDNPTAPCAGRVFGLIRYWWTNDAATVRISKPYFLRKHCSGSIQMKRNDWVTKKKVNLRVIILAGSFEIFGTLLGSSRHRACNVWCIKNRTKHNNKTLLSLVQFLMHQTLGPRHCSFATVRNELIHNSRGVLLKLLLAPLFYDMRLK